MTATATKTPLTGTFLELPLDQLHPSSDNPRRDVGDVVELATSIKAMGILEPLIVTPNGDGYVIVAGHRRHAAAELAALDTAPCIIRELDDQKRLAAMLVENLQRTDLAPIEEATAYKRLIEEFGFTQRTLADQVGRSQGHISKRLMLLDLPTEVIKALDSGGITLDDARELTKLAAAPKRLKKAFTDGKQGRGIGFAVQRQLEEHELEQTIAKAKQELKTDGVKTVEYRNPNGWGYELPRGVIEVGGYEWQYEHRATMKATAHKSQPCAAFAVNPRSGEIIQVCTNPKEHASKQTATPTAAAQKFRAHEKAMREARAGRREFAKTFIAGKVPNANEIMVRALLRRAEAEAQKVACELLGLEPIIEKGRGYESNRFDKALQAYAAKSGANVTRTGLALALATDEINARPGWSTWSDHTKGYLKLLETAGYKITPAEKLEISGKRPTPTGTR
jgi:ParB family chromosome partitioning protein